MRTVPRLVPALASCLLLAACNSLTGPDSFSAGESGRAASEKKPGSAEVRGGPATPADLVALHASSVFERDAALYEKLLDPGFEFFPRAEDAEDLPWLSGDSWDRATELGMIRNLFDPHFLGDEPPVKKLFIDSTVISEQNVPGGVEVTVDVSIMVLVSEFDGFVADTRLVVLAVPAGSSHRIGRITERTMTTPVIEGTSWGLIKALYRN